MKPVPEFADDAWLAAIIDSSEDAIISKTTEGIVTSWNRSAERVFGYSAGEMLGKPLLVLFPPERVGEEERILERIRTGLRVEHFETERVRKDGHRILVSVTVSPIRNAAGQIVGASKIARDITENRRLQASLRLLNAELEQRVMDRTRELEFANREMEAFATAVSHDLRAPLRALSGFTQALQEDFGDHLPADASTFVQQIATAGQRMETLINGLLDLSRNTRGRLERAPLALAALAQTSWRTVARATGGDLPACEVNCPWPMDGDPRMVGIIFDNLLSNAVKYAGDLPPRVRIYQSRDDSQRVWLHVHNQGLGFDAHQAQEMFKPFTRVHALDEGRRDLPGLGLGLGLGLATVKRIVERHGGKIEATGVPGLSAELRFHLGTGAPLS